MCSEPECGTAGVPGDLAEKDTALRIKIGVIDT